MHAVSESSDRHLIDLLRTEGPVGIVELARRVGVTSTAVRQRLQRLMGQGFVERRVERAGRGRPRHLYSLTEQGVRTAGNNYADLAMMLWTELRSVRDVEVRRGLLSRIASRFATMYRNRVRGHGLMERMDSLTGLFGEKGIPFDVDRCKELPVLTVQACPYPELAEQDRSICAIERMMFSEMLGENLRLSQCRLDGGNCCTFEVS